MSLFTKTSKSFGNPLYNLRVTLLLKPVTFEVKDGMYNDLLSLGSLADISGFCQTHLQGHHIVTDLGMLVRKREIEDIKTSEYPYLDAALTINDNETAMHRLRHAFSEQRDASKEEVLAQLKYPAINFSQDIYTKQGRLYVPIETQNPLVSMIKQLQSVQLQPA